MIASVRRTLAHPVALEINGGRMRTCLTIEANEPARGGRHALLGALLRVWLLALLLGGGSLALAQGAPATRSFEHIKTGFALTGQHANERCESCHINGVFKGTPRDCASCHTSGTRWSRNNVVKGQNHFPTQQACDTCHGTQSYSGAKFNHVGVSAGSCTSCHNGAMAPGKNSGHIQTTASCDSCHKTSGWTPASGFDHTGVTPGSCATCHNGSRATGKSATHVPVGTQSCDACHRTGGAWKPSSFNHTQLAVANQCSSCHSGGFPPADGRNANHIPYQALAGAAIGNCDSCHKGGFASWTPARFHASVSVSTQCASCHTGSFARAVGKPNTAIHNGVTVCESCHKSTASWAGAKVDHSSFTTATNCTHLPQRQHGHRQVGHPRAGRGDQLRELPQHQHLEADHLQPHAGDGHQPVRQLPQRRLPAGRWPHGDPHPVPDAVGRGDQQLRQLPQAGLHRLDRRALPQLGVGEHAVRELPHRQLRAGRGQAQHRHPQRRDGVRELPQVDQQLGLGDLRALGGQRRGHRHLRHLPQRQRSQGQERPRTSR